MQELQSKLEAQRTTLVTILVALGAAICGGALLYFSNIQNIWTHHEAIKGLVRECGHIIVVSVAIALLWELAAKRAFVAELLTKVHISQELDAFGILKLTYEPTPLPWKDLFETTQNLDLFFAYAKNWRGTHENRLVTLAAKKGGRIRLILPDPDSEIIIRDLARRFKKTEEGIRERIREAQREFSDLRMQNLSSGATIEIWYTCMCPVFTLYRFDKAAILSMYSYQQTKFGVPHILAVKDGTLFKFVEKEFNALTDSAKGLSRRIV